jgi:hypothetical protein
MIGAGLTLSSIALLLLLTRRLNLSFPGYQWIAAHSRIVMIVLIAAGAVLFAMTFTAYIPYEKQAVTILRVVSLLLIVGSLVIARVMEVQSKEVLANWDTWEEQFHYGYIAMGVFGIALLVFGLIERVKPH